MARAKTADVDAPSDVPALDALMRGRVASLQDALPDGLRSGVTASRAASSALEAVRAFENNCRLLSYLASQPSAPEKKKTEKS